MVLGELGVMLLGVQVLGVMVGVDGAGGHGG